MRAEPLRVRTSGVATDVCLCTGLLLQHPSITYSPHALSIAPALLFSLTAELVKRWEKDDTSTSATGNAAIDAQVLPDSAVEVAKAYAAFWRQANEWQLLTRAEEKPILDVSSKCIPPLG